MRLRALRAALAVVQGGDAAGEGKLRRAPVGGLLVRAGNARGGRHILPPREKRQRVRGLPAELVAQGAERAHGEAVHPVGGELIAEHAVGVQKTEDAGAVTASAHQAEVAVQVVLAADSLPHPRLHRVRMGGADQRHLVVVARTAEVRQRIIAQQRERLRADPVLRDHVAGKRHSRGGIDQFHRLAQRVQRLRKIAEALRSRGHQAALGGGIAIACPLVVHYQVGAIAFHQMRDPDRPAEARQSPQMVVTRLRRILSGDGVVARVPECIVEGQAEAAVIQGASPATVVAERGRLRERSGRAVIDAAVDQKTIVRRRGVHLAGCRHWRCRWLRPLWRRRRMRWPPRAETRTRYSQPAEAVRPWAVWRPSSIPWRAAGLAALAVSVLAGSAAAEVAVPGAAGGGVLGGGGGGALALIWSKGSSFSSHSGAGAPGATATSRSRGSKQSISTRIVQVPSARSANEYTPCASVTAVKCLSPWVAVHGGAGHRQAAEFDQPAMLRRSQQPHHASSASVLLR